MTSSFSVRSGLGGVLRQEKESALALVHNSIDQRVGGHRGSGGRPGLPGPHANSCAPHRPARVKTTRVDWESARLRYCWGVKAAGRGEGNFREWPSLAEVAKEFGASLSRVEAVSARDLWPNQRETNQRRLRAEVDRQMLASMATKQVRARLATFMTAMRALEHLDAHLKRDGLSPKDLNTIVLALRISQEVAEKAARTMPLADHSSSPGVANLWP